MPGLEGYPAKKPARVMKAHSVLGPVLDDPRHRIALMLGRCRYSPTRRREAAMAGEQQFTIGARASCTDGHCGEVRRLIIDPATEMVTHLVIQPGHRQEAGRLVPVHLVESTDGEIRLRCTRADFDKLDHAVERDLVAGPGIADEEWRQETVLEDVIPVGEKEVGPGDPVHAVDGEIGRVLGFLVSPGNDRVTHVLLQEGHLWGRKKVAIPISAVTGVDAGIRVNLTKEQVGELPTVA